MKRWVTKATCGLLIIGSCAAFTPRCIAETLIEQTVIYHQPAAGEVFLVWGVTDSWNTLPAPLRPPGTRIQNAVMVSPMASKQDGFAITLRLPHNALVNYGFLITKKRNGQMIEESWDAGNQPAGNYQLRAVTAAIAQAYPTIDLAKTKPASSLIAVFLFLALGAAALFGAGYLINRMPASGVPYAVILLVLIGLAARLAVVMVHLHNIPDTAAYLAGDELGYEALAVDALKGSWFTWPGRMPVYPVFLAACYQVFGHSHAVVFYIQALIGALTVAITFAIARHFAGAKPSLFAAAVVALHYTLATRAKYIMSENLFTFFLLLTVLALIQAIKAPKPSRFAFGGALLGLTTLCRPASALLPVLLPWLLPRTWALRRKAALASAYLAAFAVVMAPWVYHNYRTFHRFMPLTVPGAVVYQASPDYYRLIQEKQRTSVQTFSNELNPKRNGGYSPLSIEGSDHFSRLGKESIAREPVLYAYYSIQKMLFYWIGNPHADCPKLAMFNLRAWTPYLSSYEIAGQLVPRLLALLAALSLLLLRKQLSFFAPLLAVLAYFTVFHALLYAELRHSEPLQPLLAILIAAAASRKGLLAG